MNPQNRSVSTLVFIIILGLGAALTYAMHGASVTPGGVFMGAATMGTAFVISSSIQIANQWDKAMILRLGHFHALRGPGLFFIIPVVSSIPYWVDTRVITTAFKAEKTLTKDTVPVDVDAVLFWQVLDPKQAALAVADYQSAISQPIQRMPSTPAVSALSLLPESKLFLRILLFSALAAFSGCSLFQKKKEGPSTHIYEGDGPSLRFTDRPEKPGGEVNPY